jgi:hypothetical protein
VKVDFDKGGLDALEIAVTMMDKSLSAKLIPGIILQIAAELVSSSRVMYNLTTHLFVGVFSGTMTTNGTTGVKEERKAPLGVIIPPAEIRGTSIR